ncbi:THO complex subunit 1-like isoform X1 [Tubulanus polymorphus]|uniref:THO complex subunit 1-like isoform X1 n=1 Tax=Tubulanus polymorphus TaxID=672921 RepID=UPI003DA2C7C7
MPKTAASSFSFDTSRKSLRDIIHKTDQYDSIEKISSNFSKLAGSDVEKKLALDQAFRDCLKDLVLNSSECETYKALINLSVLAVKNELCSPSTPFLMLSDVFDSVTLERCDDVFTYVEEGVMEWKSDMFYGAGKNYLLRMCNDLLRRLSKSQNTVFCGRIQLFLARLFPLSEKSGLNLMSQFHVDNVTKFDLEIDMTHFKETGEKSIEESMDVEEGEMNEPAGSVPIDYNMYRKFWSLQDYFRSPLQCYEKLAWRQFQSNANDVLNAFTSYKLPDIKISKKKQPKTSKSQNTYFAKYLTSSKLLDLQLSDSNFRRYVLTQFIILFQYLNATVKFKSNEHVMSEEQSNWVKETTAKVLQLIKETPPDGASFAEYLQHVLQREENWNSWKNDGCPNFVREKSVDAKPRQRKKRSLGDDIRACGGKVIKMGSPELTRLWNLCPDNIEACKAESRIFLPSLEKFFEPAIEAANPENMVEDQYKDHLKANWQWTALRLLARRSPHFFSQTNQPGKPLHNFLEGLFAKMAKEIPSSQNDEKLDESKVDEEVEGGEQGQDEDLQGENAKENEPDTLSKELIEMVAEKLDDNWKKLATELNFTGEDVKFIESDVETVDAKAKAMKMLTNWMEVEGERASNTQLNVALREIGLTSIADVVFGEVNNS